MDLLRSGGEARLSGEKPQAQRCDGTEYYSGSQWRGLRRNECACEARRRVAGIGTAS
jgi:hypothetical protein